MFDLWLAGRRESSEAGKVLYVFFAIFALFGMLPLSEWFRRIYKFSSWVIFLLIAVPIALVIAIGFLWSFNP